MPSIRAAHVGLYALLTALASHLPLGAQQAERPRPVLSPSVKASAGSGRGTACSSALAGRSWARAAMARSTSTPARTRGSPPRQHPAP